MPRIITKKTDTRTAAERVPPTGSKRRTKAKATAKKFIPTDGQIRKIADDGVRSPTDRVDHGGHPEDRERDQRLARDLTANAGDSVLFRHREHLTGTENEEDDVPEDEDALEEAAQKEMDAEENKEQRSDKLIDD